MTISRGELLEICENFPCATATIQQSAIEQVEYLSKVRSRREHLHPGNDIKDVFFRKNQKFLETKARDDLSFEVKKFNSLQLEKEMANVIKNKLDKLVTDLT